MAGEQLISVGEPDAWGAALADIPHSYWHTWAACAAFAEACRHPVYLYVVNEGDTRGACAFAERSWQGSTDIFTPSGFGGVCGSGDARRFRQKWEGLVHDRGYVCGYFALHPEVGWHEAHDGLVHSNDLYVLDLTLGTKSLLEGVDRSVRRTLRDWTNGGQPFVTGRAELGEFVTANYLGFMASKGASTRTMYPLDMLRTMLSDPNLLIVGVADARGICAAHTFARSEHGAECHLNVSIRDGREFTVPMIWWGIERLSGMGAGWLHMGGGLRPGDGIAKSKEKFRPDRRPLRAAREIYRPDEYDRLCALAGVNAVPDAGFFPPYQAGR